MKKLEQLEVKWSNRMKNFAAELKCSKEKKYSQDKIDDLQKQLVQAEAKFDLIGS